MKKNLTEKCKTCSHTLGKHKRDKKNEGKCKVKGCKCEKFEFVWYSMPLSKEQVKNGEWASVRGKEGIKDYKRMKENNALYTKMLKPKVKYSSKKDTFSIKYGQRPVDYKIAIDYLGESDVRFLALKGKRIVGIEIDNLSKIMKKFDCDKNKKFMKEIHDNYEKHKNDKKYVPDRFKKELWVDFCYCSDYSLFDIYFGNKKVQSSIQLNLMYDEDLIFDVTKEGDIVGIEFLYFDDVLEKFDCDKKYKNKLKKK